MNNHQNDDELNELFEEQFLIGRRAKATSFKSPKPALRKTDPRDNPLTSIPCFNFPRSEELFLHKQPLDFRQVTMDENIKDSISYLGFLKTLLDQACAEYRDPTYGFKCVFHPEEEGLKPSPTLIEYRKQLRSLQ